MVTDTVGFIRKLPHDLVAAFRATLEGIEEAALIVHLVDSTQPHAAEQISAVEAVLAGLSILVVDDEEDARDLLRIVLESCEVRVCDAASADEALATLQRERVDLMVSDIGMPGEDGYSLIRKVRALPLGEKARIPAIALTAFARNEDRTRALLEGFNVHMAKPVEPAELLLALADLCGPR